MTQPLVDLAIVSIALCVSLAIVVVVIKTLRNGREARIRRRRDALQDALEHGGEGVVERSLVTALGGGPEEIDDVLLALGRAHIDPVRAAVLARLAGRSPVTDVLTRIQGDRRPVVRARAALILGRLAPEDAVPRITPCLDDVRTAPAAVRALGMIGTPEAVHALLAALPTIVCRDRVLDQLANPWAADGVADALTRDDDVRERPLLIEAAGLSGARSALPELQRALASGPTEERVRAARALGRLGRGEASLLAAMTDSEWAVRAQAAGAIALIGDPHPSHELVDAMSEGLADTAWWVRVHCANALCVSPRGRLALEEARRAPDRFARDRAEEALVARHLLST
jgi:HEAT repeat protein